jgi:uncharacterized protein YbaP (TraB family)
VTTQGRARARRWAILVSLCTAWVQAMAQSAPASAAAGQQCPPVVVAPTPQQIQAAQAAAVDRGFLWRISKDGRTSHLFGTLHLGRLDWATPGPRLREALASAQVMALELDITDPATLQQMQAGAAARADEPALPPALQQRLAEEVAAACLPPKALQSQALPLRAITLLMLAARWEGLDGAYAQEAVLAGYARARGMPIVALESVQTQLDVLLPAAASERLRMLDQALAQLRSGAARRSARAMGQVWAESRLEDLAAYERWCECINDDDDRQTLRRINDERNPGLAAAIDRLHGQGKPVFAGVGALHMTGPQALPVLLAQRGFRVERVSFAR